MFLLRVLMWVLALALAAVAVALWPDLPAQIPTHLDASGQPDAWADSGSPRALAAWFGLPLLGLVLAAGMDAAAQWVTQHPESPLVC